MKNDCVLGLKTDAQEAEVLIAKGGEVVASITWQAHRELSNTILKTIESVVQKAGVAFDDLGGIAVFKGPGSFTGLRIGITVANTLAYSLRLPIVSEGGDDWLEKCNANLLKGLDEKVIVPHYGAEPNITKPRK